MASSTPTFPTLLDLLRWRAEQHGPRRALTFLREGEEEVGSWTYAELDGRARSVATTLLAQGAAGGTVLLLYPSGLEFVAGFLGCIYAGAIAVPVLLPRSARHVRRLLPIIENASPLLALTTAETQLRLQALGAGSALQGVPLIATDALPPGAGEAWRRPDIDGDSLAFLQYTSGSTAEPKGVMVLHRNLLANHRMLQEAFQQDEHAVWVQWLPLFHDMGLIGNLLQALYMGGHCVLMAPEAFLMKPFRWLRAMSHYRAQTSGGPDFAYELCARRITPEQRRQLDLSAWVNAFDGAEPVRSATLDLFQQTFAECGLRATAFLPCYGLAEATLFATGISATHEPVQLRVDAAALERGQVALPSGGTTRSLVGCGRPWGDGEVLIVESETGCPCPPNMVGEIWLRGSHLAAGYWRQPEETARTFGAFVAGSGEGPYLRTGDLGFCQQGELFITGRSKDLIIIAGRNHYPTDLEQTVKNAHSALHPGGSAAFSILEDGVERLILLAEIERTQRTGFVADEVKSAIRRAVAEEHGLMPHALLLLPPASLLKTSSGKTKRAACRAAYLAGELPVLSP